MFVDFLSLCFVLAAQLLLQGNDVDFEAQVLPIFRNHCFDCHGDGNTDGELALDSVAQILQGGHTGNPLIAKDIEDSELHLRITSTSDGYRMPKRGEPLSEDEVAIIDAWIKTAFTNDKNNPVTRTRGNTVSTRSPSNASGSASSADFGVLDSIEPKTLYTLVAAAIVFFTMLGWVLLRVAKSRRNRRKRRRSVTEDEGISSFWWVIVGATTTLGFVAALFFYLRSNALAEENAALRSQLKQQGKFVQPPTIVINADNLPLPAHPMHPRRLGGQYYRGNDERDESLFNNGFYRTATIDLNLIDDEGNRLEWKDAVGKGNSIEILIRRAPNATRELFSKRVLDAISIEHFCQSDGDSQSLKFEAIEEEELWRACIELPSFTSEGDCHVHGMIYIMYGVQSGTDLGRPHFGIRYDIQSIDGSISDQSDLWMGSMFTLGGRVVVPDKKTILLDRWFDWRPMPVIEGEATTDPELLGLPEHIVD